MADGIPTVTRRLDGKADHRAMAAPIVGSFTATQTGTASANSARAAAQALQQALAAAVTEIVNWTLTAPMPTTQQPAHGLAGQTGRATAA